MAIKKSELYSSLWASCDELRGGMDASQYKDYVLVLLFVKYVTDRAATDKNFLIEVPKGGSFDDLVALKGKKDIGDKINIAIKKLAQAGANDLSGVIDVTDFNDEAKLGKGQAMVETLTNLIGIFETLDFGRNSAEGDDLLGDAYEYLMRNFATESGKSKGQFYTPAEVSQIMAKVIGVVNAKSANQTIYDPTCGSGSLLLKAHDEAPFDLTLYGQEMDNATRALAKMNMILHGSPTADIQRENTLSNPLFKEKDGSLKKFDYVVANPPFSWKAWMKDLNPTNDPFKRFEYGVPPKKKGDYAFFLHVLTSLKSTGKGAIILPHGVLFRGDAEAMIRKAVIKQGYIKGIIGLPTNLFYGTGIPACILVIDKDGAAARKGIFMIDASKGFIKDGNKNRLRSQDIHKIVDAFNKQIEIDRFSRMVPLSEITDAKNDFNLNIPRYIDSTEPEDIQDISGHLQGGIPNADVDGLSKYLEVLPTLKTFLFKEGNRKGYSVIKVAQPEIKQTILNHEEFAAFNQSVLKTFSKWKSKYVDELKGIKKDGHPKKLILELSESLLETFKPVRLIDPYDLYQHLMTYWAEVMQDDVFMIVSDGWKEAAKPRQIIESKDKKNKEKYDFAVSKAKFKAELIPPHLIISQFLKAEKVAIEKCEAEVAALEQKQEELKEEHGGEEGLLADVIDNDKIKKPDIVARLKEIKGDKESDDERKLLEEYTDLMEKTSEAGRKQKELEKELDEKVLSQYAKLKEEDIKCIVVEAKWMAVLDASIHAELDRVSQNLSGRIKVLSERYSAPLPSLAKQVEVLTSKVDEHLKKMGYVWQ